MLDIEGLHSALPTLTVKKVLNRPVNSHVRSNGGGSRPGQALIDIPRTTIAPVHSDHRLETP